MTTRFNRQAGETEREFCDRRSAEFQAEHVRPMLEAIEAHRAAGTLTPMAYRGEDPDYQRSEARW